MPTPAHERFELLLGLRRHREAEAHAREALAADPDAAWWHAQFARALAARDESDEAVAAARTAVGLAPTDPWVLCVLAWMLLRTKQPGEALEVLADVRRLDPHDSWCHELHSIAYAQLGRTDEQLKAAQAAVALAPEDESARLRLAWALHSAERYAEAVATADEALRLHPNSDGLHGVRGLTLFELAGRAWWPRRPALHRAAHAALTQALRLDPADADHAANVLVNVVQWRRLAYRVALLAALAGLVAVVFGVGFVFLGWVAVAPAVGVVVVALFLRGLVFDPPDYTLALLPLERLGLPGVPLTPEDRSQGRRDGLKWVGFVALGLLAIAAYVGVKAVVRALRP